MVVLGAGATRGAEFVAQARLPPPLDRDFFRLLQMSRTGRGAEGRALLDYVRDVYGPGLDIGMETVFSNLDAAQTFHETITIARGRPFQEPRRLIDAFRSVLPQLLLETIGYEDCGYHAALADGLRPTDVVVSLNYDCVIDRALISYAGARFSAERGGYGVDVGTGGAHWRGVARGRQPRRSIQLLKLHGSLGWADATTPIALRPEADIYQPVALGVIQPPLTKKPIEEEPFRSIWRSARRAVRDARRLVVIGYSMPPADGLVRTLLTTDIRRDLREVIVVEPDRDTQTRHIELFTRRAPNARVFAFEGFESFGRMLRT